MPRFCFVSQRWRLLSTLTREELHELVWTKPVTAIAADFGLSDVAVAMHCKKHDVPRPSRGYWAKKEAGKNPRKQALPPTKAELFFKMAEKPIAKAFRLPSTGAKLHPLAAELMADIQSGRLDSDKRVSVRKAPVPEVNVTKALAERTASAWLRWARDIITSLSPFQAGYPDPSKDGAFNGEEVPFGGPYPETRKFPHPPTMPKIPAPVVVQQGYGSSNHLPSPTPYPFWLKHQR